MTSQDFWNRVTERAYSKYLNRINNNLPDNPEKDWEDAEREEMIEEKIREEAFLHSKSNDLPPEVNWEIAKNEIMERLRFLAFYRHENVYNASPEENWIEAQKLYLEKFAA